MGGRYTIAVFGSSACKPGESLYDEALGLGGAIARGGWVLCNGGYGGTMEAACRGAVEAGGETIGVSCSAFGRSAVNRWVRREIVTHDLNERLNKLIELGDGYVVLPGSTGTLLELAAVWESANKGFISGKTIVVFGDYWRPVIDVIARESPRSLDFLTPAGTVEDVVDILQDGLGR